VLKGDPVPLDDLLGYARLQVVLAQIIAAIGDQDAIIQGLSTDVDEREKDMAQRAASQDAALAQMRAEVQNATGRLEGVFTGIQGIEGRLRPLEQRSQDFEAAKVALEKRQAELQNQHENQQRVAEEEGKRLAKAAAETGSRLDSHQVHLDGLDQANNAQGKRAADLEAKFGKLEEGMSGNVANTAKQLDAAEARAHSQAEQLFSMQDAMQALKSSLHAVKEDCEAHKGFGEQLAALEEKTAEARRDAEAKEAARDAAAQDLHQNMRDMQAKTQAQAASQRSDAGLRAQLEALAKKELNNSTRLNGELDAIKSQLEEFQDKGASGTARCLSCYSRRQQRENRFEVGTDGKCYFKVGNGDSTINLGRLGGLGSTLPAVPNAGMRSGRSPSPASASRLGIRSSASASALF